MHRWYSPRIGRYTRPDPFGIDGGGANVYLYALANPLRFLDPLGQRVVYEDFPPDRQPDAEQAVQQIKDELEDNPCCVEDDRAEQLLDLINDPSRTVKIKYRPDMNPANCGFTPFTSLIRVNNTIRIGPNAWDCCRGGSPKGVLVNGLLLFVPALVMYAVTRRKRPRLGVRLLVGWCLFYLASLFWLFPAADGP